MKVILTGSNGFVGGHLLAFLRAIKFEVIVVSSTKNSSNSSNSIDFSYEDFFNNKFCCDGVDTFIHISGAAHRTFSDEEARNINYILTKKIVDKCVGLKIPRIIFLSSVNMYKEQRSRVDLTTKICKELINTSSTKLQAEDYIRSISSKDLIKFVIIRSPLIYGLGVKANFASLMRFVGGGLPLPFRSIKNNKRSLVSVYNLVDLIKVCIDHPQAVNQIFLVSDDNDLSTAEMVALMAMVQNKTNLALPVPVWCFKLAGRFLNKRDVIDRLTGSLQLDITHTKNTLNWKPPYSVEHGFKLAAKK
ncbi:NAD-dependent epimerase/dehydratase family protein [Shewanella sp. SR43-8]|uniref:NAD-dependent epimerase/dehydratase family protein n=1 Tax=Shewanella sp. SR43-8 TaxID=2760938 RepID=UPI00160360B4|nr:NAD-dependent epimerase/dehydratase family protein [Shewanella sp. SR43-8]MBB1322658.1 NAD-dependent epimerase/dehydratase family protein [Shewanella sp. SR43-8]